MTKWSAVLFSRLDRISDVCIFDLRKSVRCGMVACSCGLSSLDDRKWFIRFTLTRCVERSWKICVQAREPRACNVCGRAVGIFDHAHAPSIYARPKKQLYAALVVMNVLRLRCCLISRDGRVAGTCSVCSRAQYTLSIAVFRACGTRAVAACRDGKEPAFHGSGPLHVHGL